MIDQQGNLLAFRDITRVLKGENVGQLEAVSEFVRQPSFDPKTASWPHPGIEGNLVVGTYVPLGTPDWAVVTELPWEEAYRQVIQDAVISAGIILVLATLAGLMGVYLARCLAVSLVNLTKTASQIAGGNLELEAAVRGPTEMARLADAFNSMTTQLRSLVTNLEQRVADRTARLEASNRELEAFAYSVSHDLRAPLRHIAGFVRLLRQREEGQLDATSSRYLDVIAESADRMGWLIDDLLAFSRTGRAEMRVQRIELDELIQEVRQELAPEMEDRHITWEIGPLPLVQADPALLRQVWVNLLSNAIKFTAPRPKARIEIGTVQKKPGFLEKPGFSEVTLFVRDNGVGFDPRYTHKLFGVFQRLHGKEEFEGTGIGLATVHRIIERHGGRVWAEGDLDRGATFYLTLRQTRGV